jgi:hypothetical protein
MSTVDKTVLPKADFPHFFGQSDPRTQYAHKLPRFSVNVRRPHFKTNLSSSAVSYEVFVAEIHKTFVDRSYIS